MRHQKFSRICLLKINVNLILAMCPTEQIEERQQFILSLFRLI